MSTQLFLKVSRANAVWLSLACMWAIGGIIAWLASLTSSQSAALQWNVSSSGLTVLSLLACALTLALRMPILAMRSSTSLTIAHVAWLLTSLAAVNWLGFFAINSRQWSDLVPVALLFAFSEAWFHILAWKHSSLPWLVECCADLGRVLSPA